MPEIVNARKDNCPGRVIRAVGDASVVVDGANPWPSFGASGSGKTIPLQLAAALLQADSGHCGSIGWTVAADA
jgi:hypothetical protein